MNLLASYIISYFNFFRFVIIVTDEDYKIFHFNPEVLDEACLVRTIGK